MAINSDGLYIDGKQYYFIPPAPTTTTRGGIVAKPRTTENIEVVVDTDGKAYVAGTGENGDSNLVADVDYLTPGTAAATYQTKGSYLTTSAAASTYQPKGDYLTPSTADDAYQPKGSYLTTTDAALTYQPKGDYLTAAVASSTYQPKGEYLTTSAAVSTYQPKGNYLTEETYKGTVTSVNGNTPDASGAVTFEIPSGLPEITAADNDKVLTVVDGVWAPAENSGSLSLEDIATPDQVLDYLASVIPDFTQEAF